MYFCILLVPLNTYNYSLWISFYYFINTLWDLPTLQPHTTASKTRFIVSMQQISGMWKNSSNCFVSLWWVINFQDPDDGVQTYKVRENCCLTRHLEHSKAGKFNLFIKSSHFLDAKHSYGSSRSCFILSSLKIQWRAIQTALLAVYEVN